MNASYSLTRGCFSGWLVGGWILCAHTVGYCLPLCKGSTSHLMRSSVTSKKLTLVVLASTVIFKSLSRKTLQMPFLIFSISCGVPLKAAKPSFWPYFLVRSDKRKHPTSSQVSAPSKDPIVFFCILLVFFIIYNTDI